MRRVRSFYAILKTSFFCGVLFLCSNLSLHGQVIAENPITDNKPYDDNPYTNGQTVVTNLSFSGIGRGSDISGNAGKDRYNAKGWNVTTLNTDKYFYFTITPNSGYEINFSSFKYTGEASNTGPTNATLRSSEDGFTSDIGTATISKTPTETTINLSNTSFQGIDSAIEFRLYAWGATNVNGTFSVNDFSFEGHVYDSSCPKPFAAGVISGPDEVLPGQSGVGYSVSSITHATSYIWTLPSGASIVSGNNTNTITVDFGDESGDISVYGTNSCGNGSSSTKPIEVDYPAIYLHDFGEDNISAHPYEDPPVTFADNLSASSWSNSKVNWTSYNGQTGEALALSNSSGSPVITLNFTIASGYQLDITHFNFWQRRSGTGAKNWSMSINGTNVGSGSIPTNGSEIGKTSVLNAIQGLTGTVNIEIELGNASGSGTFRFDDFTLWGNVYCAFNVATYIITDLSDTINSSQTDNYILCPKLEYSFNPDNDNYNPGGTSLAYRVERELSTNNWGFNYSISGGTVLDTIVTGSITGVFSNPTGTIDAANNDAIYLRFVIENEPGEPVPLFVDFEVSNASDTNCSETISPNDDNKRTHEISIMPAIGNFY